MNKFEIGSQWKTRGGWRAVVVDIQEDETHPFIAWHSKHDETWGHMACGVFEKDIVGIYDLIEPWSEPRELEAVLHICHVKKENSSRIKGFISLTEGDGLNKVSHQIYYPENMFDHEVIATKKITIKEGEFCDGH